MCRFVIRPAGCMDSGCVRKLLSDELIEFQFRGDDNSKPAGPFLRCDITCKARMHSEFVPVLMQNAGRVRLFGQRSSEPSLRG